MITPLQWLRKASRLAVVMWVGWALPASAQEPKTLRLAPGAFEIRCAQTSPGIQAAANDLKRDFAKVLGAEPASPQAPRATLQVSQDKALAPETYEINVGERVEIRGGDELGAIYGIYEFSRRFLGVDPLWFWKDLEPEHRPWIDLPTGRYASEKPVFRYRGWFLNDEDLLSQWKQSGKSRFLDWPARTDPRTSAYELQKVQFYMPVMATSVLESVCEALLRSGGNLLIPGSFIDIMNEPEAALVRTAVRRGLYVSQHHIEPLGVSFISYETWWSKRGKTPEFSYRTAPDQMRECWRAYARRWHEIAGDRVIWQVGLRGRGDRPMWGSDPDAKSQAGPLMSAALADEMAIIRGIDPRPQIPATLTLWAEGASLIQSGKLNVPENVTLVFSDSGQEQEMQSDFRELPRDANRRYGFYYHVAVWNLGPHLVQGPTPEKVSRVVGEVASKGDTAFAILNVANVREHLLGLTVWSRQVWKPAPLTDAAFLDEWCPPGTAPLYREFLETAVPLKNAWLLHDGSVRQFCKSRIDALASRKKQKSDLPPDLRQKLEAVIPRLEALQARADAQQVPEAQRPFFENNFKVQLTIRLGLYRTLAALLKDTPDLNEARLGLQSAINAYSQGEQGKWANWYQGDLKMNLREMLERLQNLKQNS